MIKIKDNLRLVPAITVDLGGAVVDLLYDFNARAALYDALTDDEREGMAKKGFRPSLRTIIKMVWAGVQHEAEPPTLQTVGSWINEDALVTVAAAIGNAMTEQGMEEKLGDDANPTPPSEAGAKSSGGSGQSPVLISASRRKSSGR